MFSSLVTLVRHTAAVTAVVLVWGGAQTAPAAAAPSDANDAVVGHHVYVDTGNDGLWDQGEPGVPGARLSIRGPDGKPPQGVDATQTTDEQGSYHFDHLEPGVRYTVTLDLTSVDLTKIGPLPDGSIRDPEATTWSLSTGTSSDTYDSVNFGFFTKLLLALQFYDVAPTVVVGPVPIRGRCTTPTA